MNDNFLKTLASFIVIGWIQDASPRPVFMGMAAGAGRKEFRSWAYRRRRLRRR